MPLPESLIAAQRRWHPRIQETITQVIDLPTNENGSFEDMCWYHLNTGGKRLRPLLALMSTEALGGDPETALPFAAGIELLHNATLVHDDFQDGDEVRRNQPTVWKKFGWEQCINAGDGLFFAGIALIGGTKVADTSLRHLLKTTTARMQQVVRGQVNEYRLKTLDSPSEQAYIDVIRGKTAGLFALPLEGAAIVAGSNNDTVESVASVGDHLGLIFQVQDDLLDLLGDKGRQRRGTDIAEGKPSLPLIHCLSHGAPTVVARVNDIVRKPRMDTTDADINYVIQAFEGTGSIQHAFDAIHQWMGQVTRVGSPVDPLIDDITSAILAPIADHM